MSSTSAVHVISLQRPSMILCCMGKAFGVGPGDVFVLFTVSNTRVRRGDWLLGRRTQGHAPCRVARVEIGVEVLVPLRRPCLLVGWLEACVGE